MVVSRRATWSSRLLGVEYDSDHVLMVVGILVVIALSATEYLGVATAVPVALKQLGGLNLYGWLFAGFTLASVAGGVILGSVAERTQVSTAMLIGIAVFIVGLAVGGLAPSMGILVLGRVLQGFGGGLSVVLLQAINRYLEPVSKGKMLTLYAGAWVLPSFVIPPIAGIVATDFGWRYVFFGVIPLIVIGGFIAVPSLRHIERSRDLASSGASHPSMWANGSLGVVVAAGLALIVYGFGHLHGADAATVLVGTVLASTAIAGLILRSGADDRLSLLRALLVRGLGAFGFFAIEPFLPLVLFAAKGFSPAQAGLVLTFSTVSWTVGSWWSSHSFPAWPMRFKITLGLMIQALSLLILIYNMDAVTSTGWWTQLAWFTGSFGMGISYPQTTLTALAHAPEGRDGVVSSLVQIFDSTGNALGVGVIGAIVGSIPATHLDRSVSGLLLGRFGEGLWLTVAAVVFAAVLGVFGVGRTVRGRLAQNSRTT